MIALHDTVSIPRYIGGRGFKEPQRRTGVVIFLSECGKYANVRYYKGPKPIIEPFNITDLKK